MAKQPEDRYPTCGELALALRAAVGGTGGSSQQTGVFALPGRLRPAPKIPAPPPRPCKGLVLGGAVALILVAASAAAGVRAFNSASPAAVENVFPNAAERELIGQAPVAFRETCVRNEIAGAASVRCTSDQGAHEIVLTRFASQRAAEDAYNRQASRAGISRDTDDCGNSYRAEHAYEGERGVTGRVLCHRDNGSSVIAWVSDGEKLTLLSATRPDADHAQLYKWWVELVERRLLPGSQETPALQAAPVPQAAPPPAPGPHPPQAAPASPPQPLPVPQAAPPPQPQAPAFTPQQEELIAHVPASFRSTCRPSDDDIRGAIAVVACGPTSGAGLVKYVQFTDLRSMYRLYLRRAMLVRPPDGPTCDSVPPDFHAESRYQADGRGSGRHLCFTNDDGKPQTEWTNEDLLIYAAAEGSDASALIAWWRAAGPV